jgi:hypothetical protein
MSNRRCIWVFLATLLSAWLSRAALPVYAQPSAETTPIANSRPTAVEKRAAAADPVDDAETAYTRAITERADQTVAMLGVTDANQKTRVRDLIMNQYRDLRKIHDALAAKTAEATSAPAADPAVVNAWIAVARVHTSVQLQQLHRRFVARLAAELSPEQVNKVKDAMTYGLVQLTYERYLEMLPELTNDQKREIQAELLEAREYAMDAGSSEEKRKIFGQYQGRINNYLSKAGYNVKQAERDLSAREKSATSTNVQ